MKQILQSLRGGAPRVAEVPAPRAGQGEVLIRTAATLVSPGTERMLIEFGQASWLGKARQQPERVRETWRKWQRDGWQATREAIEARLDEPVALGYAQAGVVTEVGAGVTRFRVGDRVVSNGPHGEWVVAPELLVAPVPEGVGLREAPAAILGAIALESLRRATPTLGETFLVAGLGPIGLLAVQLLRAQGCKVLAADPSARRREWAAGWGATVIAPGESWETAVEAATGGRGVDGVILALATQSVEPVREAARCCRRRGRIVLVGTARIELPRDEFYRRELRFEVSCSYGPGRYDASYEREGHDYPVGHVRWTAQRNIEAVLELMSEGRIEVGAFLERRFAFEEAGAAYALLSERRDDVLSVLLEYGTEGEAPANRIRLAPAGMAKHTGRKGAVRVGVIGAGAHARKILLPALVGAGAEMVIVASRQGVRAAEAGRKFGFREATTSAEEVLEHPEVDAVVIATPHATHARWAAAAIARGLAVMVEKPLADTWEGLAQVEEARSRAGREALVLTGYNRRFAPLAQELAQRIAGRQGAKSFVITVNAGRHPVSTGDRVVGEGCHFLDLARFLAGAPVEEWSAFRTAGPDPSTVIQLRFVDGNVAAIHYLTGGNAAFAKERIEVFGSGEIEVLDNFRQLRRAGDWRPAWWGTSRQDKGHRALIERFLEAVGTGGASPIPWDEQREVAALALETAGVLPVRQPECEEAAA